MRRITFCFLFIITIIFLHVTTCSAQPEGIFESLSQRDGLSQSTVRSIMMDSTGYMWFGTDGGLNRYDGYEFKIYRRGGTGSGLWDNRITALAEDQFQSLWIGTKSGLNRMVEGEIQRIYLDSSRKIAISCLLADEKGIWIGTDDDLKRFIFHEDRVVRKNLDIYTGKVYCLAGDENDLWIGSSRGLISIKNDEIKLFKPDKVLPNEVITSIRKNRRGIIWLGTNYGRLWSFQVKEENFALIPLTRDLIQNEAPISDIYEDIFGDLWICTDGNGVIRTNPRTSETIFYRRDRSMPHGLSDNSILSICGDSGDSIYFGDLTGIIWLGTYSNGVEKIHIKRPFQRYNSGSYNIKSLVGLNVRSLLKDDEGPLWAGTYGDGLKAIDREGNTITYRHIKGNRNSLVSDRILALTRDTKSDLLIGTDQGLDKMTSSGFFHVPFMSSVGKIEKITINSLALSYEKVWAGTNRGLFIIEENRAIPYGTEDNIEILTSSEKSLWCYGEDLGLFTVSHDGIKKTFSKEVFNRKVMSLLPEERGIWVGSDLGLILLGFDGNIVDSFNYEDGLPSNSIKGVLKDRYNYLWLSTDNGLCRVNVENRRVRKYNVGDGLQGKEYNSNACTMDGFGKMYFGGTQGCNSFYPSNITENAHIPPVVINGVYALGSPVHVGTNEEGLPRVLLAHHQNYITIRFAALDYTAPKSNRYRYMLEGFDPDWIDVARDPSVSYSNLPAGTYTFRVKGSNNNDVWNEEPTTLKVVVMAPIWQSPLAYGIYLSIITALVCLFFASSKNRHEKETERRLRLVSEEANKRLRSKNRQLEAARRDEARHRHRLRTLANALTNAEERERRHIATELHDSIGQTLALSKMRIDMLRQGCKDSEASDDLQSVTNMLDETINITRNLTFELGSPVLYRFGFSAALERLAEQMEEDYGLFVKYDSKQDLPPMDDEMKAFLFRAVREIIMNTIKHAGAGEVSIVTKWDGYRLYVSLKDDGRGFDTSSLEEMDRRKQSFGLFSLRERIISLGGRMAVRSQPGEGTAVHFLVPLDQRGDIADDYKDSLS